MRFVLLGLAGLGIAAANLTARPAQSQEVVVLVAGDFHGSLSPCGCTKPMSGGIKRLATAVRAEWVKDRTAFLVSGALVAGRSRQDVLKLETLSEALARMGATAISFGLEEARLGRGAVSSAIRLSDGRYITSSITPSPEAEISPYAIRAPFLIGSVSPNPEGLATAVGSQPVAMQSAVRELVAEATTAGLKPVLLLRGSYDQALAVAKSNPGLSLIVYSTGGSPPRAIELVGNTALVTPGDEGKYLIRLVYRDGRFSAYKSVNLLPSYSDDPTVTRLYNTYLRRVAGEGLLDKEPRFATPAFAGNAKCISCHQPEGKVWIASAHSKALKTLEKELHDRDPDCVRCHTVRVDSTMGFRSRTATPQLANVGCESCHGPAAAHAASPKLVHLAKVGKQPCSNCHTPNTSPNFTFNAYWKKIAHGGKAVKR